MAGATSVTDFLKKYFTFFLLFGCLVWLALPAAGTTFFVLLLFLAPSDWQSRQGWRVLVYALAALFLGLVASTQVSTGQVPRDSTRYYMVYRSLTWRGAADFNEMFFLEGAPLFTGIERVLVLFFPDRPQLLELVFVSMTMFFFSLGFERLARHEKGIVYRDRVLLWAIAFFVVFNLTESSELLKNLCAFSLFLYAYALLADRSFYFVIPLAGAIGMHFSSAFLLPILIFARIGVRNRRTIVVAVIAAGLALIGPYRLASLLSPILPSSFAAIMDRVVSASQREDPTSRRTYIQFTFYSVAVLACMLNRRDMHATKHADPILGLGIGWAFVSLACFDAKMIFLRLVMCSSPIFGVLLLLPLGASKRPALGRTILWTMIGFAIVSAILLYNAALRPDGYYSMVFMDGRSMSLLSSSLFDFLRYSAPWGPK